MEAGAASGVLALSSEAGIPLAPTQADLTPFQRMVLLKEIERQHEEANEQDGAGQVDTGPVNQMKAPRGGGRGETVVYTNEHKSD
ncbi:hypothetical protein JMJ58_19260 [Haloterrigena salifodinae]|uniref:Uncharacterized protein n=1 Tax=Haloterrigena salifodinae TaxID=2675099 RepID=A0A8T8E0B1_9EURY|nr:hypothetical protein [Haloterrigena salifodinae]QRV15022.1 hypothetical protein JMJ58_19260 [Haloterrigena salifodinae]